MEERVEACPQSLFFLALRKSIPVLLAYFPLSLVFGYLFCQELDFAWYYAPLMSAVVYAGSVQFMAVGVLAESGSYLEMALTATLLCLRNSFYALAMVSRASRFSRWGKALLSFGLVDATFALLSNTPKEVSKKDDERYCLYLAYLIYIYWVVGSGVGAYIARDLPTLAGTDFIQTALFTVLALEQYYLTKAKLPFGIAFLTAGIAYCLFPGQMLLIALVLTSASLLILHKRRQRR